MSQNNHSVNPIVFPPFLKPGDKVGVVAPASVVRYDDLKEGIAMLRDEWELEVVEGTTLKSSFNQFSATDEDRLQDLQRMLDDPEIKAVIAARGGYGCSRIIDQLDYSTLLKSPKWVVGFSDLTALLAGLYQNGIAGMHAPMAKSITQIGAVEAAESLKGALFGNLPVYDISAHELNRIGEASGQLIGGNLCLFAHLIGSPTDTDTNGKILFIEDVNEYMYNLDRMMIQLKRAGKLDHLAGLIVGQFSDMRDNSSPSFGKDANEIIAEHTSTYKYPVCYNFPVGHVADNRTMIVGATAHLAITKEGVQLRFQNPSADLV
ncbi:LD-carboxypeptidase [Dyadobacter luteus]|jgi:muramoyltetrapeptide carboxypeptidase|uniref:LD-carboxypeptidase n=1 Tax=Dyadobacter luteus TaxID=2259619 RepID=A0A3D8Y5C9_9BACT|nr:LD-carboxypeptidase [Dyadobacter luteus]REA57515.1 LD-carboxypeptidase [Dyadobacter luteus]